MGFDVPEVTHTSPPSPAASSNSAAASGRFARTLSHRKLMLSQQRRRPSRPGSSGNGGARGSARGSARGGSGRSGPQLGASWNQPLSSTTPLPSRGRRGSGSVGLDDDGHTGQFTTEGMTKGEMLRKKLEALHVKRQQVLRARRVLHRYCFWRPRSPLVVAYSAYQGLV